MAMSFLRSESSSPGAARMFPVRTSLIGRKWVEPTLCIATWSSTTLSRHSLVFSGNRCITSARDSPFTWSMMSVVLPRNVSTPYTFGTGMPCSSTAARVKASWKTCRRGWPSRYTFATTPSRAYTTADIPLPTSSP